MPKRKTPEGGQDAPANKKPSKMTKEMAAVSLENEMLKKTLAERKKHLDELRKLKAEEAMLLSGQDEGEGEGDGEGERLPPMAFGRRRMPFVAPRRPDERLANTEEFENTFAEFQNTDGKVEVYRLKDNTYAKIGAFPAKEWGDSLEGVAKKFGGGTFKVKLRSPDGTFSGETIVTFDEEAYPKPSQRPQEPAVNHLELLRMLQEKEEKNQDKFMTMMTAMMTTLAQTIGGKSNMISTMSDLAHFKELFANDKKESPDEGVMKLLKMFEMGMEFKATNTPAVEGESGFLLGLAKELLTGNNMTRLTEALKTTGKGNPPVRPALPPPAVRPVAPAAMPPAPPPPPPAAAPAEAAPAQPEQPAQEEVEMDLKTKLFLATYRPIILGYAKAGKDPRQVAEMIVARIPDEYLLIVDDVLKVETTKEAWVYTYAPELREFDPWVSAVMSEMSVAIAEAFSEPAEGEGEPEGVGPAPDLPNGGEGKQQEQKPQAQAGEDNPPKPAKPPKKAAPAK